LHGMYDQFSVGRSWRITEPVTNPVNIYQLSSRRDRDHASDDAQFIRQVAARRQPLRRAEMIRLAPALQRHPVVDQRTAAWRTGRIRWRRRQEGFVVAGQSCGRYACGPWIGDAGHCIIRLPDRICSEWFSAGSDGNAGQSRRQPGGRRTTRQRRQRHHCHNPFPAVQHAPDCAEGMR